MMEQKVQGSGFKVQGATVERELIIAPDGAGWGVWFDVYDPLSTPAFWCSDEARATEWAEEQKKTIEGYRSKFNIRRRPVGCRG